LLAVQTSKKHLLISVEEYLLDMRGLFKDSVSEDYHDMICYFFTGYSPMFESMRKNIVIAKEGLEPLQKEHHDLFLRLMSLENEHNLY